MARPLATSVGREFRVLVSAVTSGWLNPGLGQLRDDGAHRRWQARITRYLRDVKPTRPKNYKKKRCHRPGQSRRYQQDRSQANSHNGNLHTSDHHGCIPPSSAFSSPSPAPGKCAMELPTTRAETRTRASLVRSVLAK